MNTIRNGVQCREKQCAMNEQKQTSEKQNQAMHQPSLCEQDMHEQGACGKGFCYAGSCMWHCVALSPHGLTSCCLLVSATLVHRCPDVRWLFWFPANVRIAVLITAQCPGLWLRPAPLCVVARPILWLPLRHDNRACMANP